MKKYAIIIFIICIAISFMGINCSENPTSLQEQQANLDAMKKPADWKGKGGNPDAGDAKGGEYGDLLIVLRDVNGVPVMSEELYLGPMDEYIHVVQPLAFYPDGSPVIEFGDQVLMELDAIDGSPVDGEYVAMEVSLGRMNLVRSPQSVLDAALLEAKNALTTDPYVAANTPDIRTDFCGRLMAVYGAIDPETGVNYHKTIDSPRENLAIYQDLMINGFSGELNFLTAFFINSVQTVHELAASALAAGSDKTGTVDDDEVVYMNRFFKITGADAIVNADELDAEGNPRLYYNFGYPEEAKFSYDRFATYSNRLVSIKKLNSDGTWDLYEPISIWACQNHSGLGTGDIFTPRWQQGTPEYAEAFAVAADDAVQALEFVHNAPSDMIIEEYIIP